VREETAILPLIECAAPAPQTPGVMRAVRGAAQWVAHRPRRAGSGLPEGSNQQV
jgi:hypothetical protein